MGLANIYDVSLVGGMPRQFPSKKPKKEATSGTAFFISDNGEALTNAHVVEDCQQIRVALYDEQGARGC